MTLSAIESTPREKISEIRKATSSIHLASEHGQGLSPFGSNQHFSTGSELAKLSVDLRLRLEHSARVVLEPPPVAPSRQGLGGMVVKADLPPNGHRRVTGAAVVHRGLKRDDLAQDVTVAVPHHANRAGIHPGDVTPKV